jgi:hypothetical protein
VSSDAAELYRGSLENFVERRTAMAKALRSSDAAAADALARLRKPSVSAWAIDQVAAEEPSLVTELLAAGADVRDAQQASAGGAGTGEQLRVASARLRRAIDAAATAAAAVLERSGHPAGAASDRRIRTTLQAAATGGGDGRVSLWRGTLDRDVEAVGFGDADGATADPPELTEALAPLRRRPAPGSAGPKADSRADARDIAMDRGAERRRAELQEAARRARALAAAKRDHADRLAEAARLADEEARKADNAAQVAEDAAGSP